jgi:DNA-binding CsgD family transcriptional regulator
LVAEGCTNAEIGERLWTTEHTARRHLVNIFAKLDARSRAHCVHLAYQRGLLKSPAGAGDQP